MFGLFKKNKVKNMFEGAQSTRRLLSWSPSNSGPKRQSYQLATLRRRARDLYRNNAIARAAIDKLVADTLSGGVGCRPNPELSKQVRDRLVSAWEDWSLECDFDGLNDFYGLQASAMRAMLIDGECLILIEPSNNPAAPIELRLLEADHLPYLTDPARNIVDGIEFDANGRRTAYHLYPMHPGDNDNLKTIRIPASKVVHLFQAKRPGQIRGESILTPVLVRLKSLDEFDDAVLERQRLANLFVGFIRKPEVGFNNGDVTTDEEPPLINMEPGTMQELLPGEDITFASPPNQEGYENFTREQLRRISSALGIPYFLISGDYTQVNDRTARVSMTAYRRQVEQLIKGVFVPIFVRPVRIEFIKRAVLTGLLPSHVTLKSLMKTDYIPEAWAYINPVQEVSAEVDAINAGLKSRSESLLQRGRDIEEVDANRAKDLERETQLGLKDHV
ncbi:phage portal protein [Thiomicrorhabdus sp.]|uniref:phage portal protein n=1 Tax=Thiomicrorhabdus sp. TaxID=2039724 RepID=UPI0029C775EA|nr:phage portal protein [Thiomicrorhabdus sp.]